VDEEDADGALAAGFALELVSLLESEEEPPSAADAPPVR
jgi:hypothetical protein